MILTSAVAIFSLAAFGALEDVEFVLPPGQDTVLKQQMVGATAALTGDWQSAQVTVSARSIDVVFVSAAGTSRLTMRLMHPSVAPEGAVQSGDVSLTFPRDDGLEEHRETLRRHFANAPLRLRWQRLEPESDQDRVVPDAAPAPSTNEEAREANTQLLVDTLRRIQHLRARGDASQAVSLVEALDPTTFTAEANLALFAVCLRIVGDNVKAEALATPLLTSDAEAMARIAMNPSRAAAEILASNTIDLCATATVADFLLEMGEHEQAIALLAGILEAHPNCTSARLLIVQHLVAAADGEAALGHLAFLPDEVRQTAPSRMIEAAALRLVGKLTEAIDVVEEVVRSDGRRQGDMGTLLGMYLREKRLQIRISKWHALAREDPDDIVPPFMIGVLLHYGNDFEESTRWLQPLMGRLEGEPRLFVYIAMNAFNLGDKPTARRLLDEGAQLDVVDPDIYYCRAEITRDSERDLAIDDLHRYLALTEGTPHADAKKQQRVKDMLSAIVECKANGTLECEGPFEHPRRPFIEAIRDYGWWITGFASALLAMLLLWGWRVFQRSRRSPT